MSAYTIQAILRIASNQTDYMKKPTSLFRHDSGYSSSQGNVQTAIAIPGGYLSALRAVPCLAYDRWWSVPAI